MADFTVKGKDTLTDQQLAEKLIRQFISPDDEENQERPIFLEITGTMPRVNSFFSEYPHLYILDGINYSLRSISQVLLTNNPVTGFLVMIALFVDSPWRTVMGLLGMVSANAFALLLGISINLIRSGLFGCNGLMLGLILAYYDRGNREVEYDDDGNAILDNNSEWNAALIPPVIIMSLYAMVLMLGLGNMLVPTYGVPPLLFPACIAAMTFMAASLKMEYFPMDLNPSIPSPVLERHDTWDIDEEEFFRGILRGISRVFFMEEEASAVIILVAWAISSPTAAVLGVVGSVVASVASLAVGVHPDIIYDGFVQYNAILTMVAVAGTFYVPTWKALLFGTIAAITSVFVYFGMTAVLMPAGLPPTALPFCTVSLCFILLQAAVPALIPVALSTITVAEDHMKRYLQTLKVLERFQMLLNRLRKEKESKRKRKNTRDPALERMLRELSPSQLDMLERVFNYIDESGDGYIEVDELIPILETTGAEMTREEILKLFDEVDPHGAGSIDLSGFCMIMLRRAAQSKELKRLKDYFEVIDRDGSGTVSVTEMVAAMNNLGSPVTEADIEFLFQEFGQETGSPQVSFDRFAALVLGSPGVTSEAQEE
eukprot:Rmarinus@m.6785